MSLFLRFWPNSLPILLLLGVLPALTITGSGCASRSAPNPAPVITRADSIPLSQIGEDLGMYVSWHPKEHKATLTREEDHIVIEPDREEIWICGQPKQMPYAAYVAHGEIYISAPFYRDELRPILLTKTETEPVVTAPADAAEPVIDAAVVAEIAKEESLEKSVPYQSVVTPEKSTPESTDSQPPVKIELPTIIQSKFPGKMVVIDPGHGGHDPGALGPNGHCEKKLVLAIATKIAESLRQNGVPTMMTRDRDVFVPLEKRAAMANEAKSDCFVSIHLNSAPALQATGFEIWLSKDRKGIRYAKSLRLARYIRSFTKSAVALKDRGVRKSNFVVVQQTQMPAVLVECGFISNKTDREWLAESKNQELLATQIAQGIMAFLSSL